MDDPHNLGIDTPTNLAYRSTIAEANAFADQFRYIVPLQIEPPNWDGLFWIHYQHHGTGRKFYVLATYFEIHEDPTRLLPQRLADLFPWATSVPRTAEMMSLDGPLLGLSGRVDSLLGCNTREEASTESDLSAMEYDGALMLYHLNGPLGSLGKLSKDLRYEIYKFAFPRSFWQCYHPYRRGLVLTLLGLTHSSKPPGILNVSKAIREEVLESAYLERRLEIIVGLEVIAFNFPAMPGLQACQTLEYSRARLPVFAELFIVIQDPFNDVLQHNAVRANIDRVIAVICCAAAKQSIPFMRVSFNTNEETSSRQYEDSELQLIAPFFSLCGFTNNLDATKPLLVIERPPPHSDARERACGWIEDLTTTVHQEDLKRKGS